MKIQLCGIGHIVYIGDSMFVNSIPVIAFYHDSKKIDLKRAAWEALILAGVADSSVVEIVASETTDKNENRVPYAIVTYEEGVETPAQVTTIIKFLTETVGLNVEVPLPIKLHRSKK